MVADNKIYEPLIWPYRLLGNLLFIGAIWLLTFGVITIRHNLVGQQIDSLLSELYQKTATAGWGLEDVTLQGRHKTLKKDVLEVIKLQRGDNILEIDLNAVHDRVMSLPWVKEVSVTRRYFPNVIHIAIKEKTVRSIWQYQNKFHPIDEDGNIIDAPFSAQKNLLQIVGEGAPDHIRELMQIINKDKELSSRIKAANFISKRRWDLIFDDIENGVTVKMPEENLKSAWKKLVKLDKTRGILKRKLTFIDLRLKNKVIVKIDSKSKNNNTDM